MRSSIIHATAVSLFAFAGHAYGAEFDASGYHEKNCTRCHGSEVYTRDNRRVQSFSALEAQVARCDANLAMGLFPEDLGALVEHLNTRFYRFDK
jgi:hypothetical protein